VAIVIPLLRKNGHVAKALALAQITIALAPDASIVQGVYFASFLIRETGAEDEWARPLWESSLLRTLRDRLHPAAASAPVPPVIQARVLDLGGAIEDAPREPSQIAQGTSLIAEIARGSDLDFVTLQLHRRSAQ